MAFMQEKKEHDFLMKLLQKHFDADEIEEALQDLREGGVEDNEQFDEMEDELEDEKAEMLPDYEEENEDEDEDEEEEELELPKDKRKGLAVVIIQKRMSKPKKDM